MNHCGDHKTGKRIGQYLARGLTLVEITITVAILALVAAVAVPTLNNLGIVELRSTTAKIAGTIKSTYDNAALSGQTHRLAFHLKEGRIDVEVSPIGQSFPNSAADDEEEPRKRSLLTMLDAQPTEEQLEQLRANMPSEALNNMFGLG